MKKMLKSNSREKTQKKKAWRPVAVSLILTLLLISCTTTKQPEIKTAVVFPDPVQSDGTCVVKYDASTDTVSMPLWYWKKIVRYAVDTGGTQ